MLPLPRGAVWQLLFLFCAALYINGVRADGRVVCYYTNWSVYRPGTAKFNPQNINPYLCTHLIYAFGGFTKDNQMKPFDKYQDIEQGGYAKFTGLKTYNKQLKTMIAIGGWNEASSRFSPLVASSERRQKFIKNILKFLRQNHFDGIDLDWEYPAHREGGKPRDKDNYAQFVQELRAEFERESEKTGRPRLLLTMAVPAGIEYIEKGYDIPKLNKYLDWFNLLTYDFHSSHEPSANHHAPLYSLEEESEYNYDAELNIDYSIKFYLNAGADRDKLVLGIPTYGRSFTLINEESTEIGAPAEAPGDQGDATREKGYLAYYEICQNIKEDPEWTVVQPNPNAMGPYAYRRNQWVGYDDEAIVRKKAQYVVDNGLGGIMFWAIDNDDFRGTCTGKPYPLIEAAKDAMLDALGLGINEVSKPSAPQKPSRSRSRENSASTRNRITTTEHKLTYAERKGSPKRTQVTNQQTTRNRQQSTTTSAPTNIKLTEAEGSSLYVGGRTTTPPPPTTPDPGTDFKCEDEGFFQHPRDCKKYYWCLDSGPSGLGIVAHQFTCPSGLYFNPAADSCDFARNVPCKTKKSTTVAPITSPATTTTTRTTSSFNRITAATSRPTTFFRTTPRTTTTTEAPEEEIEYEEEDENPPSPFAKPKGFDKESEEDPQVIKELIELIRKVGGIEELEKHLLRKDDGTISIKENSSSSSSSLTATTPSSISKSLYEKVLSKPNALSSFRNRFTSTSSFRTTKTQVKAQDSVEAEGEESHETDSKSSGASAGYSKYSSVLRGNSRQGPQSEGLDKLSDFDGFLKEKKQYTTINRNRGIKKTSNDEEEEDISSKVNAEEDESEEDVSVKSTRRPFAASTPAYSTIRRTRPSLTTEATDEEELEEKDVTERKSYSSLNRSRVRGTTTTELPDVTEVTAGSSRYKYLERTRPTRPTTESSNKVTDEEDIDDDNESENQENTVHFKAVNIENTRETQQEITTNTQRTYASIGRRTTTSTTATPETETTTTSAAKTRLTTTTAATPTTTSTTETPLTTPLTILESTTPESILITTITPITTTTNPTTISTTTANTSTTKTTTTTSPNDEDVLESLATTTPNPNEISSDISETLNLSQNINSLLTETASSSNSTPNLTTESGLDTNEQEIDSQLTTTTETTISTINDSDNLTKTEDKEQEEVNLVSKQRNKTLYTTRTRTTTTTTTPPPTTTTTTNSVIETTPSPTNAKKSLGVRRQQILLNRSSQTKTTSSVTTTDIPTTTTESVNNDFLGTVSSPRPFGFPKRRNRPTNAAGITTTEETVKSNDETLVTKQKTTKLNAAANSQTKKYQFQRRTTTAKTTSTTTENPLEVKEADEATKEAAAKAQVNVNEGSERETSTNIPETTAPITTESPSSPATPLHRRIKVFKLKRPVVTNVNNTNINITTNANASSATNLNASHTETQHIVKLSSVSEVDSQIAKTQTLTETETTATTPTAIPSQNSPTPKRFRKVIRKLIRPVNRTTESTNETQTETFAVATSTFLQRRQNTTRYGFNRNSKFNTAKDEDKNTQESSESNKEDDEEETEEKKTEELTSRGRNRFTLPSGVTSTTRTSLFGTGNRNRFVNRPQSSSTTEGSKTNEKNEEEENGEDGEDEVDEEDEDSEEETLLTTTAKPASSTNYTSTNRFRTSRPTAATTENSTDNKEDNESSITSELENTTHNEDDSQSSKETTSTGVLNLQKLRNKATTEQVTQQEDGVLKNRFKSTKTAGEDIESDDPLLKLRNKVKQDLVNGNNEEGVLSNRFKFTKVDSDEEEIEKDDSFLKLRNKVKQDLAKVVQVEGVLSDRFKISKVVIEDEKTDEDNPLLKLRNKVKQDLAKVEQVEGVLSDRFKNSKLASDEDETEKDNPLLKLRNKIKQDLAKGNQVEGVLSDRLKSNKSESQVEDKKDTLLKLRNKVKQELAKGNQEEGVVSVKFKKLLETKNTSSVNLNTEESENDSTTHDSLNLQKIRDKVQTNLAKSEEDQGVVNSRLKKLLAERTSSTLILSNSAEEDDENGEATTEIKETSGDGDLLETSKPFAPRKPFVPKARLSPVDNESQTQTQTEEIEESTTAAPRVRPTFRRKLIAKRPYVPTKPPLSALRTTSLNIPTSKKKYVRRKFGRYHPFNASNRNTGEGFVRTDPRGNILPGTDRFKVEGSDGGQSGEDYEEYDEEEGGEEEEAENIDEEVENIKSSVVAKPVQPVQTIKPIIARPPGLFNRPQSTILQKPAVHSKEQGSGDNEDEDEEAEEDDDVDEDEDEEEDEDENAQDAEKSIINRPTYKPKDNRIPPGARPSLTTTQANKNPFTPSRIANTPNRPSAATTTTPSNRANRFGGLSRSTVKPRVINRPPGVSVPNLTIKPVANDYEHSTVLIPTKPAPFINPNTRAYERKYTGPTTEVSVDLNNDNNPLIEDLNIEALNARNKKIFDINSKKHTTLKPKVNNIPLAKLNDNTQEQQQTNTEFENDESYLSSVNDYATTITSNTNTQHQQIEQEQEHSTTTTLDNTSIGTQNTDDANLSNNLNNLNEISSQDGFTTTPSPSATLLHIFTLSDAGHTTQNPLAEGYQVVPRLIVDRGNSKHKVVEINRIVEVNSKEEKLRRKSKANTIVAVEGSQTYKVESLPHVEQLGEISVVKYVHQVDGSDITIEGRSTVTDYTPTEPTVPWSSHPVRHSLPEGNVGERYGKALVPEVIREAIETSTISLEGLFESARKGKVLNTIEDMAYVRQDATTETANVDELKSSTESSNNYRVETTTENVAAITSTEGFNILKSIAFDVARINLEPNSKEIDTVDSKFNSSLTSSTSTTSTSSSSTTEEKHSVKQEYSAASILTTTPAPEILKLDSSTVAPEDTKATTVAAALFPQYVRPIVPLLRPESNESSPLVISIANLDKVILSKVRKMVNGVEVEEDEQVQEHQETQPQNPQQIENNIIPNSPTINTILNNNSDQTQTQQNSEIPDSNGAFSSRLASIIKAPLLNSLKQTEKQVNFETQKSKSPLDKIEEVTQTELYTINEGSVGSTTSSTTGSKISETVSFSSETTVVRRKQPRKLKSRNFKTIQNSAIKMIAPATELVSES